MNAKTYGLVIAILAGIFAAFAYEFFGGWAIVPISMMLGWCIGFNRWAHWSGEESRDA